jgi:hypothetical protein
LDLCNYGVDTNEEWSDGSQQGVKHNQGFGGKAEQKYV